VAIHRHRELARLIKIAARRYGIPSHVLAGLITVESGWNPNAVSSAQAFGLTQFIPSTARAYHVRRGASHGAVASQILGAAHYLHNLNYKGNRGAALARYSGNTAGYAQHVLSAARPYYHSGFFRGVGGGGGGASGGVSVTGPSVSRSPVAPGGTGLADLIGQLRDREKQISQPQSSPIQPPSFAAAPAMPKGYQDISSGPPPAEKTPLSELLKTVDTIQGGSVPHATVTPGSVSGLGGGGGFGSGRYVHPFPGAAEGRTDQGVDFTGRGRILAIGNGRVIASTSRASGWPEGGWISYKLTDGPHAGRVVYVAEGIAPHVRPGQRIRAGQHIASFRGRSIEMGWGTDRPFETLARSRGHVAGGSHYSPEGAQFRAFLHRLRRHRRHRR
jgi:hypothetical protein